MAAITAPWLWRLLAADIKINPSEDPKALGSLLICGLVYHLIRFYLSALVDAFAYAQINGSDVSEDSRVQQRDTIETSSTIVIGNPQTHRAASITEKSPYILPLHLILIYHHGEHRWCLEIHLAEGRQYPSFSCRTLSRSANIAISG